MFDIADIMKPVNPNSSIPAAVTLATFMYSAFVGLREM